MFLARIDGTVVPAAKNATLDGCRFLVAQRLEADGSTGAEPLVLVDLLGASFGSTVLVSTDGDIARRVTVPIGESASSIQATRPESTAISLPPPAWRAHRR